ncbi:hypothetical protein N752_15340 [Desulforamulus aquiferis]|nr:hypothetical protein N752_15340 [Desulforamulus aquiferis]
MKKAPVANHLNPAGPNIDRPNPCPAGPFGSIQPVMVIPLGSGGMQLLVNPLVIYLLVNS